jgi:hypothetical protein
VTALVCCLGIAALNLIVDPFGIYRLVDVRGFNNYKPERNSHVRLFKAYAIRRVRPSAIVLGTSRCDVGISTTHPGWDPGATPRYNLGLDGATTHEMYAYLCHAQAIHPLRQVVLGLDAWQLTTLPSGVSGDFDEDLLDGPELWRGLTNRLAELRILFNADTALADYRTVQSRGQPREDSFGPDGHRLGEVLYRKELWQFINQGPGAYFAAIDRREIGFKFNRGAGHQQRRGSNEAHKNLGSLEYVRKIIGFCRAAGVDLRIFTTPAHAHQMEISNALGEGPMIAAGKRNLARMVAEDAREHPGARRFTLWDFSEYSSVTTEPVPPPGSWWEMAYYWDSSHFKERVGNWILDRMFEVKEPEDPPPADFGAELTIDNVDLVEARIQEGGENYRAKHPDDVAAIRTMVSDARRDLVQ